MSADRVVVPVRQLLRAAIDERRTRMLTTVAVVRDVERVAERFARIRLEGDGLCGYRDARPADAFKLHLPATPHAPVPIPDYDERGRARWPAGAGRPLARPFTVVAADPAAGTLSFDALLHPGGATARWIEAAAVGDQISLTGMRTEFVDGDAAEHHLLVADASGLPAVAAIVRAVPVQKRVTAVLEIEQADRPLLPRHPRLEVLTAASGGLPEALQTLDVAPATQAWVGAESDAVRSVRRVILDELGIHPDALHASGYWKRDADATGVFEESLDRFNAARDAGLDVGDPGILQRLAFDRSEPPPPKAGT